VVQQTLIRPLFKIAKNVRHDNLQNKNAFCSKKESNKEKRVIINPKGFMYYPLNF